MTVSSLLRRLTVEEILHHPWMCGGAADTHLGDDYAHRVKTLAMRRKLKSIFVPLPLIAHDSVAAAAPARKVNDCQGGGDRNRQEVTATCDALEDVNAEARHYFDLMLSASAVDMSADTNARSSFSSGQVITREGLRLGMAKLLNDSCSHLTPDPHCHAGHTPGLTHAKLKLTPGVEVNVDEVFDVINADSDCDEDHDVIDFCKFRKFYLVATRGHT